VIYSRHKAQSPDAHAFTVFIFTMVSYSLLGIIKLCTEGMCSSPRSQLPYGTKILHGIKFYGFTVAGRSVKLKSVNFYYYAAKILGFFDNRKI